jgi:hypothetical protein
LKLIGRITGGIVAVTALLVALGKFTDVLDSFLPKHVTSIEISDVGHPIRVGDQLPLHAVVLDKSKSQMPGKTAVWASKSPDIAGISPDGLLDAKADGVAEITASCDGISSTAMITIKRATVSKVNIWPEGGHIQVNDTLRLEATAFDSDGNPLPGKRALWASDNNAVASVEPDGTVRGQRPGQVSVSANIDGQISSVPVPVDPAPAPPQGGPPAGPALASKGHFLIRPSAVMMAHVLPQVTIADGQKLSGCTVHLRLALGGVLTDLTSDSQTVTVSEEGNMAYSFGGTALCGRQNLPASGTGNVTVAPGKTFKVQAQRRVYPPMVTVRLVE